MNRFRYLIIGNSAGAVGCIEGIREVDPGGEIAVVSDEPHHVYSRALIPYYLAGKIGREKLFYRPGDFYEQNGVVPLLGKKAVRLDPAAKEVELADGGRIGYGKLLLATGAGPFVPPGIDLQKRNVFSFLSLDDVLAVEERLPSVKNAAVLGGGVIGLMAAEVLKKKGKNVFVLELAKRVLAPVVDETASGIVEELFAANGIKIYTGTTVREVVGGEELEGLVLTGGRSLPCDLLIVAVGVVPRTELAREAGLAVNRGIVVDRGMRTSAPGVYACGDCAEVYDFVAGSPRLLPLWPNAYSGGKAAGANMAGGKREFSLATGMNAMHFFDYYIINAGVNVTQDNSGGFDVLSALDKEARTYRKFALRDRRLKGFILAGEVARAGIFLHLMRREIDVGAFAEALLKKDFGYADLPAELRWELLKDDVVLGVV